MKLQLFVFLLVLFISFSGKAQFVEESIPEGFEDLPSTEVTLVDVVFNQNILGSFRAEFSYDEGWIKFDNSLQIVKKIPQVKNVQHIAKALDKKLASNETLLCQSIHDKDCGELTPSVVGVILDSAKFKVYLFINPNFLKPFGRDGFAVLPPPSENWSYLTFLNGSTNKTDENESTNNFIFDQTVSKGRYRFNSKFLYASQFEKEFGVDELTIEEDDEKTYRRFGYINSSAFNLLPQAEVFGLSIETNLRVRTNLEILRSSAVSVYLTRSAQVVIKRNETVVYSRLHRAGLHMIDTGNFPEGAYYIDIEIREFGGNVKTERRFFSRLNRFPPRKSHVFKATIGFKQEAGESGEISNLDISDSPVFSGTYSYRLLDNLSVHSGIVAEEGRSSIQTGLIHPYQLFSIFGDAQFDLFYSSDKSKGLSLSNNLRKDNVNFTTNFTLIDNDLIALERDTYILNQFRDTLQINSSLSVTMFSISHTLRYDYSRILSFNNRNNREVLGYQVTYPFTAWSNYRFNTRGSVSQINKDETVFLVSLDVTWDKVKFPRLRAKYSYQNNDKEIRAERNNRTAELAAEYNYQYKDTAITPNMSYRKQNETKTFSFQNDMRGNWGSADLFYNKSGGDSDRKNIGASYGLHLASSSNQFAFGGRRQTQSAVIVNLKTNDPNLLKDQIDPVVFNVYINNGFYSQIKLGENLLIPLASYQQHRIRIKEDGNLLANFDNSPRVVTLYDGSVETMTWEVQKVVLIISKLVDEDGNPLKNHTSRILTNVVQSDESGWVQAEIPIGLKEIDFLSDKEELCTVQLPELSGDEPVVPLEDLICEQNQGLSP